MKKHVNMKYLYLSVIITLLSTYVLPCHKISEFKKSFGYPFGWFTVFYDSIGDIIINSTAADFFILIIDIIVWYLLTSFFAATYKKFKLNSKEARTN